MCSPRQREGVSGLLQCLCLPQAGIITTADSSLVSASLFPSDTGRHSHLELKICSASNGPFSSVAGSSDLARNEGVMVFSGSDCFLSITLPLSMPAKC